MWIDSHCHLNHEGIREKGNASALVDAARQAGVDGLMSVCCLISEETEELRSIASHSQNVWYSIGTHPHNAGVEAEKQYSVDDIVKIAHSDSKIIALGETGLDYFYDNAPRGDQKLSFEKHIAACIDSGLPMIVHTRDAEENTYDIMKENGQGSSLSGVMHCFSGSQWLADKALDMGFYISFSGIITFKKADELRETAKIVPLDKVLVETDAPFLAPVPYRGKTNEPAYVTKTGEFLAELYGVSTDEFARITTENFYNLFTKAQQR